MAVKASAILIVTFLITALVLAAGNDSLLAAPVPAAPEIAAATPEITLEATAEATESATQEPTAEATLEGTQEAALVGDPVRGQAIFEQGLNGAPACTTCHSTSGTRSMFALAPDLKGIAERGAQRIPGMSAPQYIEDSIRRPSDFIVPGFHVNMYPNFGKDYSDQDIADLVAYLLTL